MNIPGVHIERIKALGYTESEARFLYIIAVFSGYFTLGQFRAFRRVSYLVEQGVSRDIIKAWIGHGSDAMIEKYLYLRTSYRAAALANVPSLQPSYPTSLPNTSGSFVAEGTQVM